MYNKYKTSAESVRLTFFNHNKNDSNNVEFSVNNQSDLCEYIKIILNQQSDPSSLV